MSRSQFHHIKVYTSMHGLILNLSLPFWQVQPGNTWLLVILIIYIYINNNFILYIIYYILINNNIVYINLLYYIQE